MCKQKTNYLHGIRAQRKVATLFLLHQQKRTPENADVVYSNSARKWNNCLVVISFVLPSSMPHGSKKHLEAERFYEPKKLTESVVP